MSESAAVKLVAGLEAIHDRVVQREWTLAQYDPELPAVFSTPAMIGLMEVTASHAVHRALSPDTITVGIRIEVEHLKAVPAGASVTVRARLTKVNGRRLVFDVEATCGPDVIGRGRIHRAIVQRSRFAAIANGNSEKR